MTRKRKTPPLDAPKRITLLLTPPRDRVIEAHRKRLEHGRNPLAAWDAFLLARKVGMPAPEWVLDHLQKTAEALMKIPRGKVDSHVMMALGLRTYGKGNAFTRYLDEVNRWRVVRRVHELSTANPSRHLEQVYMDVAEEFERKGITLDTGTIKKWFRELGEIVRET